MLGGNVEFRADHELRARGLDPVETPEDYEKSWPETVESIKHEVAAEHDEVTELGGLYALGTERHESRRIDNQLRGRSGARATPGVALLSLARRRPDAVVQRGDGRELPHRVQHPGGRADRVEDGSNAIRSAQTQVEAQNFEIRKNVLKYDEVLNRQRTVIYDERRRVLHGEDLHEQLRHMTHDVIDGYVAGATADGYAEEWDLDQLWTALKQLYPVSVSVAELEEASGGDRAGLSGEFISEELKADADAAYDSREADPRPRGDARARARVVLSVLDRKWREHLYEMDYLQEGIGLRAMAQRDPLVEYQREGFDMFAAMMDAIKEESVGYVFNLEVQVEDDSAEDAEWRAPPRGRRQGSRGTEASDPGAVLRTDAGRRHEWRGYPDRGQGQ